MAFQNTSAGVYDQDKDASQRGGVVISSTAAIVVESSMGSTEEWVLVTDKADLKNFGIKEYTKYGFSMHCAEQFVTESRMYVKRAVNLKTARTAGAYLSVDDNAAMNPVLKLVNFDDGSNKPQGVLGNPLKELGFTVGTPGVSNVLLFVCASSPGEWAKRVSVRIRPSNQLGTAVGEFSNAKHFYVDVFLDYVGSSSVPVETYLCSRQNELDGEQQQMFVENRINGSSKYIRVKNNALCPNIDIRTTVFEKLDGGADGDRCTDTDVIAAWSGIEDTDSYEVQLLIGAGFVSPYVQQHVISIAQARGDAIAIIDLPTEYEQISRALNYRNNILNVSSSYGALYGPFIEVTDDVSGKKIMCPPSGMVAARYAYTDRVRAYYWAPAGLDRGQMKVTNLSRKYNLQERNALQQAQINYIRRIPGRGFVIFEQQTLQNFASGFQNVNVRRLVNGIKAMIRKAFLPSVFNPNDQFERNRLKNIVDTEAAKVKRGRGMREWETICDERNNTSEVIANNDMAIDFVIDPSIPATRASLTADIRNYGASMTFTEA